MWSNLLESLWILAFSTDPKNFERNLDLFDFFELDRRLFAIFVPICDVVVNSIGKSTENSRQNVMQDHY